ncbi:MAG: ACT domain-containing protein [Bacteroidota bacterium]
MPGEKNLSILLKNLEPELHAGDYVYCTTNNDVLRHDPGVILFFKEPEGHTLILEKETADRLELTYTFIASWITITVHSALDGVGLTAAFSTALADAGISCNVVAAFYHDHIFVDKKDAVKAMEVLQLLSRQTR